MFLEKADDWSGRGDPRVRRRDRALARANISPATSSTRTRRHRFGA